MQISRLLLRQFRAVLRQTVPMGSSRTAYRPMVALQTNDQGLRLRSHHADVLLEWLVPGSPPATAEEIVLPVNALTDLQGRGDESVSFHQISAESVEARWEAGGTPQTRRYETVPASKLTACPLEPTRLLKMQGRLLPALSGAAEISARQSAHSSWNRICLRGTKGEVVSTNGHELLVQRGFTFPWKDDVLIPSMNLFGGEVLRAETVKIGKSPTHLLLVLGAWRLFLTLEKDRRFPRVEGVIPADRNPCTTLKLAPADSGLLRSILAKLECNEEDNSITLDLASSSVVVRIQDASAGRVATAEASRHPSTRPKGNAPPSMEWTLKQAQLTGPAVRVASKREILARALRLGFTEFQIRGSQTAIVANDRTPERGRLFVWLPLSDEVVCLPAKDKVRNDPIDSTISVPQPVPVSRSTQAMPAPSTHTSTNQGPPAGNARSERPMTAVELIAEAEALRTLLQDASTRVARLLAALKQHRRQSRAMQAAVHSLKQLQLEV